MVSGLSFWEICLLGSVMACAEDNREVSLGVYWIVRNAFGSAVMTGVVSLGGDCWEINCLDESL